MSPVTARAERWQSFVDASWGQACRETGYKDESQCPVMAPARALSAGSLDQGIDALCDDAESTAILHWVCASGLHFFSDSQRLRLVAELCRRDPSYAGGVYLWRADLTDEEDALIYAAFAPHMPRLVERVARFPECRAKVRQRRG